MLGTLVQVRVGLCDSEAGNAAMLAQTHKAIDDAFDVIATIQQAMSAHHPDSDLARLSRASPGTEVRLNPHTVQVLRLACYWHGVSGGAFDPVTAANRLYQRGVRPAFQPDQVDPVATLHDLHFSARDAVVLARPLRLDLGGIAKGYAVDQAILALAERGVSHALVNAGGDMRSWGDGFWPVALRDPHQPGRAGRSRHLRGLCNEAVATSTAGQVNPDFVATRRRIRRGAALWTACTVRAPDCVTADALTKWGLQTAGDSPRMRQILRQHGASLWRT